MMKRAVQEERAASSELRADVQRRLEALEALLPTERAPVVATLAASKIDDRREPDAGDEVEAVCFAHACAREANFEHRATIEALVTALESVLGRADAAPGFSRANAVGARVAMSKMHALLEAVLPELGEAAAKARAAATAVDDLRTQARSALAAADSVAAQVRRADGGSEQ
jgi:hypothetical protein